MNRDDDGDVDNHGHNRQRESKVKRRVHTFDVVFHQVEVTYLFARSLSRKLGQPVNRKKKRVHVRLLGRVDPFRVAVNACTFALAFLIFSVTIALTELIRSV